MPKFLIIKPDPLSGKRSGRGTRGRNLELFLREYFGSNSVRTIDVKSLSGSNSYNVDHLFVGIPSEVSHKELKRVSFREIHLFDYGDHEKVIWENTDKELLSSMAKSYLKTWTQKNWGDEFNWGALPIRRHKRLSYCIKWHNFFTRTHRSEMERAVDTTFIGNPAVSWNDNPISKNINIRIQWLEEISSCNRFSFSGGFFRRGSETEAYRENASETLKAYFLQKGRVNFLSYFNLMINAKTALAPPGNALWSYRHYEAIYAGSIPVSADFQEADMLVPLPVQGMVHVGSGESVLRHIELALKTRRDHPELPSSNMESLERYLSNGLYDRRKTLLLKRFMGQIEKD